MSQNPGQLKAGIFAPRRCLYFATFLIEGLILCQTYLQSFCIEHISLAIKQLISLLK
jgi:hypothetical protein